MSQEKHSIASFLLLWRSIGAEAKVTSNKVGERVFTGGHCPVYKTTVRMGFIWFLKLLGGPGKREGERPESFRTGPGFVCRAVVLRGLASRNFYPSP